MGLMTGDVTINPNANCIVMTTEILRSMIYRGSELLREVAWVIFDEIHYMQVGAAWLQLLCGCCFGASGPSRQTLSLALQSGFTVLASLQAPACFTVSRALSTTWLQLAHVHICDCCIPCLLESLSCCMFSGPRARRCVGGDNHLSAA